MATQASSSSPSESRLQPLVFAALNSGESNFLEWLNDAKTLLSAEDLAITLETDPEEEIADVYKSQALLILRRHLDHALRLQYIQVNDPARLWSQLNARFNHQQTLSLPQARSDWINMKVFDFLDFVSFNLELHRITAQLKLCGETISEAETNRENPIYLPPCHLYIVFAI
jgi:hypothetical protein